MTLCQVTVFLFALLPLSLNGQDPFAWLYGLQGQRYYSDSLQTNTNGGECPDECDCPPTFPIAMYCDGRGLTVMPTVPSHVKYLYLQNNGITAVPDSALNNATSLVWLMMHNNQLTSEAIGKKVRFGAVMLRSVAVRWCQVTPVDLEGMDNLTILYLHDNAVTDMSSSLQSLKSLTLLDISSNKLTKVPKELPEQLHQLYLDSNSIDSLPEDFLGHLTQLQYIRMAHNQLTDKGIPPNTFNVTGLVELDLSFNKLERIPLVSTTLQHLYLQANQIKEFTLGSFCSVVDVTSFSKLQTLRMDGNEISREDIPSEASLCLRQASSIEVFNCYDS
uniref:Fibromodulin n=1 Tax=Mastacembelus armatus TaxID=205130 RepID=A0A7N8WR48_9TELE